MHAVSVDEVSDLSMYTLPNSMHIPSMSEVYSPSTATEAGSHCVNCFLVPHTSLVAHLSFGAYNL